MILGCGVKRPGSAQTPVAKWPSATSISRSAHASSRPAGRQKDQRHRVAINTPPEAAFHDSTPMPEPTASNPQPPADERPESRADADGQSSSGHASERSHPVNIDSLSDIGIATSAVRLGHHRPVDFIRLHSRGGMARKAAIPRPRSATERLRSISRSQLDPLAATPSMLLAALQEQTNRLPPDNRVSRLNLHRRALDDFIDTVVDPNAKSLLRAVQREYDALHFEGVGAELASMLERVSDSERRQVEASDALKRQQRRNAELQLELENCRRELSNRNEILAHIAATHHIAIAGFGDEKGPDPTGSSNRQRSLTLTDIRRNQQRVADKYGAFVRHDDQPDDDDSPLDAAFSPPDVTQSRLKLFQESRTDDAAAVDLEADVPADILMGGG